MANKTFRLVRMTPEEKPETGTAYYTRKPNKGEKASEKLRMRKYDPVLMKHVIFVEKKMPSHS